MEVLRLSGASTPTVTLPTSYPNEDFTVFVQDSLNATSFEFSGTSLPNGNFVVTLPSFYKKYDGEFEITLTDSSDDELTSYGVSYLRPYCEPATAMSKLGITEQNAIEYERVARFIIDSRAGEFRRYRKTITATGLGLDYLPIRERITKIYSLKENSETVDPTTYSISNDQTSIVTIEEDRLDSRPVWRNRFSYASFTEDFDYEIDGDFGWQTIPSRIQEACLLLMQDISCGNNKYVNKYIQEYATDGYTIKFAKFAFTTTGNKIVDDILARYTGGIGIKVL